MKIFIERLNKTVEHRFQGTAAELLAKLEVNPETVLVVRNNLVVTEKDVLENDDQVRLLSVISGG